MFKKNAKSLSDKETASLYEASPSTASFTSEIASHYSPPQNHFFSSQKHPVEENEEDFEEPETTIAENIIIKGTLKFEHCLRIDGAFEGDMESPGKLIIGPTGTVKANLHLDEVFISGKLIGDVTVKKRLVLRGRAEVRGNITAPLLSIDEGVSIQGMLKVSESSTVESSPLQENNLILENSEEPELPF